LSRTWSRTTQLTQIPPGSASASSRAATFTPGAEDVVLLNDHVAEVDADAELDPLLCRGLRVALGHVALDLRSAPDGINHACELGNEAIARVLDNPPAAFRDLRIDECCEMRFQALVRALFVDTHKPRIPRHIGS
jgi:hypothetical protein